MEKIVTFKDVIQQYNNYYQVNVKKFNYKNMEELEDILQEIFDLEEDTCLEVDWDNEEVIIYEN